MKKTLVLLALAAAVTAYSQGNVGTVLFQTYNTGSGVDARARYTNSTLFSIGNVVGPVRNGTRPAANTNVVADGYNWGGVNARAGLYGGPAGTTADAMVLLVPAVGFQNPTQGGVVGYVDPGSDASRYVSNGTVVVLAGQLADFQVRAWDAGIPGVDSYEAALAIARGGRNVYLGQTEILRNIATGNVSVGGNPPSPASALTGLNGGLGFFMDYVGVPEPSIIGLGILGAIAGLVVFRRRN